MSQPITANVQQVIESETPRSTAAGASIAGFLKQAFDELDSLNLTLQSQQPFEYDQLSSSALSFAFKSGSFHDGKGGLVEIAAGTVSLTNNATNYVELDPSDNTVKANTTAFTSGRLPLYQVVTSGGTFTPENVTSKRALLAILYGKVVAAANLADPVADAINDVGYTIAAEVANARDITIQVKDIQGNNLAEVRALEIWLADATNGWETGTAPSGGITVQTGVAMNVPTTNKRLRVMTNSSGVAVIRITESGTRTWYMACKVGAKPTYSGAIAFA